MSSIYEIYGKAKSIMFSSKSWEEKYDLIFSDEISKQVNFDWYDPDMDYQDDVMAFMNAFDHYMENNPYPETRTDRDLYNELRGIGLTSDQCCEVLDWVEKLPIQIEADNISVEIVHGMIKVKNNK